MSMVVCWLQGVDMMVAVRNLNLEADKENRESRWWWWWWWSKTIKCTATRISAVRTDASTNASLSCNQAASKFPPAAVVGVARDN